MTDRIEDFDSAIERVMSVWKRESGAEGCPHIAWAELAVRALKSSAKPASSDGGSPGQSPLAAVLSSSDPASGRGQPSPAQGERTERQMLDEAAERVARRQGQPPQAQHVPEGWQPIETAPKDGRLFLVATSDDIIMGRFINEQYFAADSFHGNRDTKPTHWMPLPAAPKPGERP